MNIMISMPGTAAAPPTLAPAGASPTFSQQFGAQLLSAAPTVGIASATMSVVPAPGIAMPVALAGEVAAASAPLVTTEGETGFGSDFPVAGQTEIEPDLELPPSDAHPSTSPPRAARAPSSNDTAQVRIPSPEIVVDTPDMAMPGLAASAVAEIISAVVAPLGDDASGRGKATLEPLPEEGGEGKAELATEVPAPSLVPNTRAMIQLPPEQMQAAVTAAPTSGAAGQQATSVSDGVALAPTEPSPANPASKSGPAIGEGGAVDPVGSRAAAVPAQAEAMPASTGATPTVSGFAARLAEAYPASPAAQPMPVVEARTGTIGHDMGVAIARQLSAGKEELIVRLNPAEMGRVEVRMGFDEAGSIRAVVAVESPAALDLLRRDAGDLVRALGDAGIRSDSQSFRFDSRGGESGQSGQRSPHDGRRPHDDRPHAPHQADPDSTIYRPLRSSGRVDLLA